MDDEHRLKDIKLKMLQVKNGILQPLMEIKENLLIDISAAQIQSEIPEIYTMRKLIDWAVAVSAEVGTERVLALLEATVLTGYLSRVTKEAVIACLPDALPAWVYSRYTAGSQLQAAADLMLILGKNKVIDLIALQIAARTPPNNTWPEDGESQSLN